MGLPIYPEGEPKVFDPPTSVGQVHDAAFEQSRFDNTEVMSLAKMKVQREQMKMGPQKTPDELNQQFPGHRFEADMTEMAAQTKVSDEEERRRNNEIIEKGNTGFLTGVVVPFVASMEAIVMDPIGAAINFATAGLGRMAADSG